MAGFRPADRPVAPSSCNRTLQHLREADAVAAGSEATLLSQNQQLQRVAADLGQMNRGLDQNDAHIRSLERSHVEQLAQKGMKGLTKNFASLWGSSALESAPVVDPGGAPVMSGWLAKRGPMLGYKWERRWVVLCPKSLSYYSDSTCKDRRGEVSLLPRFAAASFRSDGAPGDALRHRGERPFGLVVHIEGPEDDVTKRRFFYFDTESEADLKAWLRAFHRVGKALLPREATSSSKSHCSPAHGEREAANSALGEITEVAQGLNERVLNMQQAVQHQGQLVGAVNHQAMGTQVKLDNQNARTERLLQQPRSQDGPCMAQAQLGVAKAMASSPACTAMAFSAGISAMSTAARR